MRFEKSKAGTKPTIDLDKKSDTGPSSSDNVTFDTTPTLSGTAAKGAKVVIFDGEDVLGTVKADKHGDWTFTADKLTYGEHQLSAVVKSGSKNSVSDTLAVVVEHSDPKSPTIALSTLPASQGFVVKGDGTYDTRRFSVATAGDINGDGFADIIIGSRRGTYSNDFAGEAVVIFGTADGFGHIDRSGRDVINIDALSETRGFLIQGDPDTDSVSFFVSSAGDINGDGFDDVIVGSRYDAYGRYSGAAYVIYGKASGFGDSIDLTTLSDTQGFVIEGDSGEDALGSAVSSAGDLNGDGFDDLIVGAPDSDTVRRGFNIGEAFIVFDTDQGLGTLVDGRRVIDIGTLGSDQGFVIRGDMDGEQAGGAVASAGDVNGDGFDDLIIGANNNGVSNHRFGRAYVIFGTDEGFGDDENGRQVIDLRSLDAAEGFIVQGYEKGGEVGFSVASAGDINGDGLDDVLISKGPYGKQAFVVYGADDGFGVDLDGQQTIDLETLDADQGFVIKGNGEVMRLGQSVSSAGDVNGDGFDDIIVASYRSNFQGTAFLVFGGDEGFGTSVGGRQVLNVSKLRASQGAILVGEEVGGSYDYQSVAAAGDVNGDGYDDLMVGAHRKSGGATIVFGSSFGETDEAATRTGTSAADLLIGGLGDDTIIGGSGADVLVGGYGKDLITIADAAFRRVAGGGGTDTLALAGANLSIDFTAIANRRINSIERLDISGTGANSATLGAADLFHFSKTMEATFTAATLDEALVVLGDDDDALVLKSGFGSWTRTSNDVGLDGSSGGEFDIYTYRVSGVDLGFVAIDKDVTLDII